MKNKDFQKLSLPFFITCVMVVVICTVMITEIGNTRFISACVRYLIPATTLSEKHKSLSFRLTDSLTNKNKIHSDRNDSSDEVDISNLAYTPQDIKKLIVSAKENYDESEKGGTIVPQIYGESASNMKAGNVLIKNTTGRTFDIAETLKAESPLKPINKDQISVLIFHTHTTETYQILDKTDYLKAFSPRTEDENRNMIRVGREIASQLEQAGIGVIHDTQIYDRQYSGAYDRSGKAIDEYLKKYPSIQVVLDVHRDAIQTSSTTKVKPVTTIGGKKAAQIMIITGCEGNGVTDFPDWEYNLRFALRLQKTAEDMYPTLMRPLFFCNRKYNMYKTKCSILLEMGSDGNTLDEAAYSGRLIGNVLAEMLSE